MDAETSALLAQAASLRRAGRIEEAIAAYRDLLEREPDLADSWYNLGWLQRKARQFEAALGSYDEALKRGVRDPEEVRLNRAVILADDLARPEEAEAELREALSLNPAYLPALLNLGNLHEDLGRRGEAQQAYRRALEIAPGDSLALSRLAGVTDAGSPEGEELIASIRAGMPGQSAAGQADLGFALGRLLDARGDYDAAFAAYERANSASRESFGPDFRPYDRAEHEAYVDKMIAAPPAPMARGGTDSPSIFIAGMFRSGSTLVEQILAGHSSLAAAGELDLVPALVPTIGDYPEAVAAASGRTLDAWREFYLAGMPPSDRGGRRVTDKRPDNFLHIGFIKTLFPDAKIVHTRRNRLDNLLSLYFLHLGPGMPYGLDLADADHWHRQYERLMAHWKSLYPDDIFDVDYDALVRDPKPLLNRLTDFLGLEWDESLLDFHRREGAVKTASVWQVREPLHARSSGRWRNYRKQMEAALGDLGVES